MRRQDARLMNVLSEEYNYLTTIRNTIVLAFIGSSKATKSSFINYILQRNICPIGEVETTARITKIIHGDRRRVYLESDRDEARTEVETDEDLYKKAEELIKLRGTERSSDKCKDIVVIEVPIKQLYGIELWDIPGFDENNVINDIVIEVRRKADVVFALMPIRDTVRQTFVDMIEPFLEERKNGYRIQICFVITQIDLFTEDSQKKMNREDVLRHLFENIQKRLKIDLGTDAKSSCYFLPLCTAARFNLNDFLMCRTEFIEKSTKFFEQNVLMIKNLRLNYLLTCLHILLDYEDVQRNIDRSRLLEKQIRADLGKFQDAIKERITTNLARVKETVLNDIDIIVTDIETVFRNNTLTNVQIQERFCSLIFSRLDVAIYNKIDTICEGINQAVDQFFNSFDFQPQQVQTIQEILLRTLSNNPYRMVIGQYQDIPKHPRINQVPSTVTAGSIVPVIPVRLSTILFLALRLLFNSKLTKIKFFKYSLDLQSTIDKFLNALFSKEKTRILEHNVRQIIHRNVAILVDQFYSETSDILENNITEQMNQILDNIKRKNEQLSHIVNTNEASSVAKFLKQNKLLMTKLYFDICDKITRSKYSICNIGSTQLGVSNYPVFDGQVKDKISASIISIACKRIPYKDCEIQEVRYSRELHHPNIVTFYGVTKSPDFVDTYFILMQRLDCDLIHYFTTHANPFTDTDIDSMIHQIISGLAYLHAKLIIHRDIKPANVLVQKEESPGFLIADFGFVHQVPVSLKGTPGFIAPEYLFETGFGPITEKVDIFAFGISITYILEKAQLISSSPLASFWKSIAGKCCSKTPSERPTSKDILDSRHSLHIERASLA